MFKKVILNFARVILISLPIIVLTVCFFITFWGEIYILKVDQSNRFAISQALEKDNISFDNLNETTKIDVCGAGLNSHYFLSFYNEDTCLFTSYLYNNKHYYIEDYLIDNSFNVFRIADNLFFISIFISLSTIFIPIYIDKKSRKKKDL